MRRIRTADRGGFVVELWVSPDRLRGAIVLEDRILGRQSTTDLTITNGRARAAGPVPPAALVLMQDSGLALETTHASDNIPHDAA